jgi:error-prone DNA polymerase
MLKIAMVMADFTGDEAEELRRALGYRSEERMNKVCAKLRATDGMQWLQRRLNRFQAISSFAL